VNSFVASLKKKGPGGLPVWVLAVGAAVVLYFGYRWFSNRSGGSSGSTGSSSGAGDSGQVDTGGGSDTGLPSEPSPDVSTALPDTTGDTAPPAGDSTGVINGAESIGVSTGKRKKKKHPSAHDHKQGTKHTNRRAVHRRKPGTPQTPHAHAPKEQKRPPSAAKARTTVKASTAMRSGELVLHGGAAPRSVSHPAVAKRIPAPVPTPKEAPRVSAKAPAKKKR
jgi:hypothetical protein